MKKVLFITLIVLAGTLHAQSRTAGEMVVPSGYESYDSLRFGIWGASAYPNALTDSVHCKFAYSWGSYPASLGASQKGFMGDFPSAPAFKLATFFKQWIFYGLPQRMPYAYNRGYFWRYNDASGINSYATYRNNLYDANDISPYSEYPQNDSLVRATFHTLRYNNVDSIVANGNEGRVIAAYNNERSFGDGQGHAGPLSCAIPNTTFPEGPGGSPDTAKMY
ncbi:MAG TPA: hypothetical protein VGM92_06090, partial [Candidatus Kapabacteria bacterium]